MNKDMQDFENQLKSFTPANLSEDFEANLLSKLSEESQSPPPPTYTLKRWLPTAIAASLLIVISIFVLQTNQSVALDPDWQLIASENTQ